MPTAREMLPFAGSFDKEMFFEPNRTTAAGYVVQLPGGRVGMIYKFVAGDHDKYRVCTVDPDPSLRRAWHSIREDADDLLLASDPLHALACLLHLDQKHAQEQNPQRSTHAEVPAARGEEQEARAGEARLP